MSTPTPTEAADHERIWLEPLPGDYHGRQWCQDKVWPSDDGEPEPTEYVRADIHAAALALIESQRATIERVRAAVGDFAKPTGGDLAAAVDLISMRCATAEARVTALEAAIGWALGEGDSDFGDNKPENAQPFWWRTELRARAALSSTEVKNDGTV